MKVIFSVRADQDLAALFEYISKNLNNDIAAHNIANKVLRYAQKLSGFPELGSSLAAIDSRMNRYRYLIIDNYLLVYKIVDEEVFIVRTLYAKSNYVRLLLG